VTPMPDEAAAAVAALAAAHASLPHPEQAGRHIAMPDRVTRAGVLGS